MDTVTMMKDAGITTRKAMLHVASLVEDAHSWSNAQNLVDLTLMLTSSEMREATDVGEHCDAIEQALLAKLADFTIDQFAAVCSVMAFDSDA